MDRPDKPPRGFFVTRRFDLDECARVKAVMDAWTSYIASRMTVRQMRDWLDANRWGGNNPYLKPRDKAGIARTVATMILDDRFAEPERLKDDLA
jgi:hypothetical protein